MSNYLNNKIDIWPFDDIALKKIIISLIGKDIIIQNENISDFITLLFNKDSPISSSKQILFPTINERQERLFNLDSSKEVVKNTSTLREALVFRFPFDILPYFQFLLTNYWDEILCNLVDKWKLTKIEKNIYISKLAQVDESIRFKGSAIIGPNSIIKNNVTIGDRVIVDERCLIENYAKISKLSYIGPRSEIGHCAEISAVIFSKAFIIHSCYFRGVMGHNCNLGAGTVTGTDRFDNGYTKWFLNDSNIPVTLGANDVYIGSNSRTGVNVSFCSGSIIGKNCIVGPGTLFKGVLNDSQKIFT